MRRTDKEITNINDKMAIIQQCKVCRLGLSENNLPYIVPLNYGYTLENNSLTLFFHSASEGKKLAIIRNNNNACFEIDCEHKLIEGDIACHYSFAFKSVIGFGAITLLDAKAEKAYALNQIMKHQTGRDLLFVFEDTELARVTVYKMVVIEFSGKQKVVLS
jgi:nitroimidazol reductase NimA-like FMN-containing flavoprotein (pyridoxamine 5'-phosphate oxidase superfamily)